MEAEMGYHLGYEKSARSDSDNARNGYKSKRVNSSYGNFGRGVRTKSWTPKGVTYVYEGRKAQSPETLRGSPVRNESYSKLGYPTREGFYKWLSELKNPSEKVKAPRRRINNRTAPPPPELKLETIRRLFEHG